MLWGWPFSTWEWVVKASLVITVVTGVAAAFFAFVAGYVGYELADAVGKVSDEKVAVAMEAAGKANERAAIADKATEAERLERIKLQAAVAPRNLSLEQQKNIADLLHGFDGKSVAVATYALDNDAASLALQIISVLTAAHIVPVNNIASIMPIGSFALGIHVLGADELLCEEIATALVSAGGLGVAPPCISDSSPGGAIVTTAPIGDAVDATILIGVKPIQLIGQQ